MSREVRRVPGNWQHPTSDGLESISLFDGIDYEPRLRRWDTGAAKWAEGLREDWNGGWQPLEPDEVGQTFEEWWGPRPLEEDFMPRWTDAERTHLMMYETCTEGSPISPAFETPEDLARWLADNGASAFGHQTASYESWLATIGAGWAPSALVTPQTGWTSGVEAMASISGASA